MAKIRHEINILDTPLTTGDSPELIYITPSSYSGTLTWYFEVYTTASITVYLHDSTNNVHATATGSGLVRVQFSTPPTEDTYHINVSGSSCTVARVICIQETNSITASESQIEMGGSLSTTSITAVALTNPKYWTYNSASWDGIITAYFEASIKNSTTKATYAVLQYSTNWSTWNTVSASLVTTSATTSTLVRSSAFTPVDGYHYRVALYSSGTMYTSYIYNAKIIIKQQSHLSYGYISNWSASGGSALSTASPKGQSFQVSQTDTLETVEIVVIKYGTLTGNLYAKIYNTTGTYGTDNLPTGNALATSNAVDVSILPASGSTQKTILSFASTNKITLSTGTTYCVVFETDAVTDGSNYLSLREVSSSYTADGNFCYYNPTNSTWVADNTIDLSLGIQVSAMAYVTELEEQYLLLNTADSGTGLQNKPSTWDSNEWSGVTNIFNYVHDSDNASNSSKLMDITPNPDADITNATVTGAYQVVSSTAFTMPTSSHVLDIYVTNSSGIIGASRIIVNVIVITTTIVTGSATFTGSNTLSPSAMLYIWDTTNLTGSANLTVIGTIISSVTSKPLYFNIDGVIKSCTKAQANIGGSIVNLTKAQANIDGVIKDIWISS